MTTLALGYLTACTALFFFQRSLIYFPQPRGHLAAPTIELTTESGPVLVTTRPRVGEHAVLYFGGNAEDVSGSVDTLAKAFPEHALYLMHYRGYGGSAGAPSETELFADAVALFERATAAHRSIAVVGRSLGSGVAVHLASVRPVAQLTLVTPYHSIQALAEQQFPLFPVRWLLRDKFESWRYAEKVTAPTLLVAAEHDEVIPAESTAALLSRFPQGIAQLAIVPGVGHNTISDSPEYARLIRWSR